MAVIKEIIGKGELDYSARRDGVLKGTASLECTIINGDMCCIDGVGVWHSRGRFMGEEILVMLRPKYSHT